MIECTWIGGGNTGRNTTVIRSNYPLEPGIRFQDESLRLRETLSACLDFNLMVSPRVQGGADPDQGQVARLAPAAQRHEINRRRFPTDGDHALRGDDCCLM